MELRYLKAFMATAKYGSFSKAADSLQIAQSAVSRQIKLLEEACQQELVIRSSKHIVLTQKGKQLYELAALFLEQSEDILYGSEAKSLRIGTVHGILENWLKNIMIAHCSQSTHPLDVRVLNAKELEQGLMQGDFDIIISPAAVRSELVDCRPVFDEARWLVSRDPIDTEQLEQYRWLIFSEDDPLLHLCHKRPASIITVNSMTTIFDLVEAGCGIALLPTHVFYGRTKLYRYKVSIGQSSPIYLSNLRVRNLQSPMKELIELIESSPPPPE